MHLPFAVLMGRLTNWMFLGATRTSGFVASFHQEQAVGITGCVHLESVSPGLATKNGWTMGRPVRNLLIA